MNFSVEVVRAKLKAFYDEKPRLKKMIMIITYVVARDGLRPAH